MKVCNLVDRNFFIILGTGKAGTTSLCEYLNQHPEIYISPVKETHFFESREFENGLSYYWQTYFPDWNTQLLAGEASTPYLYVPFVPERIHRSLPEARLIAVLRNPVERAYSHWWMEYSRSAEPLCFEDAIQDNMERLQAGICCDREHKERWYEHRQFYAKGIIRFRVYLDQGYYAEQLQRYFTLFPRDQIRILLMEDLKRPEYMLLDLFEFLKVSSDFSVKNTNFWNVAYNSRLIRTLVGKSASLKLHHMLPKSSRARIAHFLGSIGNRPEMKPETRQWLVNHYCSHNRTLETLIGRSLAHWNQPQASQTIPVQEGINRL